MSEVFSYLWLIPALPLLAATVTAFFGPRFLKHNSHWPCVASVALSALLSFAVFFAVRGTFHEGPPPLGERANTVFKTYYTWFEAGTPGTPDHLQVGLTLRADPLTAIMLITVTFIGLLIAIYSIGYMHDDPGYPRFFAAVALFITSMTLLVLGDNFLVLFAGWEGVGLCSYLLIGFWYSKPAAAAAARKAFLVTRIGDAGMLLGISLLWFKCGSLQYDAVFATLPALKAAQATEPWLLTAICLLLFCGAAGKSAQFPLHVWLPDAMEGPTPVSALIHAATMVTAGVYLVARCTPLFSAAPDAQLVVACIGGFTALLAALIALTQTDLKRVLAYSTLSQLGYMFLALGSAVALEDGAEQPLVILAVTAAIFHLHTHAFFKALLFLSAGSVMHAMGGVIDMRKFSGLKKVMPTTRWTFLCGAVALAGLPIFSGFWSKDEILAAAYEASHVSKPFGGVYIVLFLAGLITAGLTSFYTFRAYFMTFEGEEKIPHEAGHHAHESPPVMTVPLQILAFFALFIGLILGPTHLFGGFLEKTPDLPKTVEEGHNWILMLGSTLFALAGTGLAYYFYLLKPALPALLATRLQGLYQLSYNKFYIDDLYDFFIVKPLVGAADFTRIFDKVVVDSLVDVVGEMPPLVGALLRPLQNGLVQYYAVTMMIGLTMLLIALARS